MAAKFDPKELVTFRNALLSGLIQFEALVNLLDRKGVIDKDELQDEIQRVHGSVLKPDP